MDIKQQIDNILNKKMDREGFLKHAGLGLIAVAGATTIGKLLISQPSQQHHAQSLGYGDAPYGGKKEDVA